MNQDGFSKLRNSAELTKGEKGYIFDFQFHFAGSFHRALYEAIHRADEENLLRLQAGFPDEVQGFLAWTRGDLYERASRIAGGDVGFVERDKESA